MIIDSFNRENWKMVSKDIVKAVQSVGKKYGVEFKPHGGTIGGNDSVFKFRAEIIGSAEKEYRNNAKRYGLPEDGIGRKFTDRGRTYTIVGFKFGKYSVKTVRDDGKEFGFTVPYILPLLNPQSVAAK